MSNTTGHGSVFGASDNGQQVVSILLNGSGDVTQFGPNKTERWTNTSAIPTPYTLTFNDTLAPGGRPGRYLLRLINTSIGSTFIFSIDNHLLTVVSADFVPIYPYMTTSVLIGIGQRYNVIVEADPTARGLAEKLKGEQNYWIRTWVVDNCGPGIGPKSRQNLTRYPYMQTGIVRYDNTSTAKPISKEWNDVPKTCSDETYTNLRPVLPWVVGNPINTISTGIHGIQHVSIVGGDPPPGFPKASIAFHNDTQNNDTDASHDLDFTPLQIDFSRPILLELNNTKEPWNSMWQVYPEGRDGQENDWVNKLRACPPCILDSELI
jgi:FtsP/CotA-like multicopper oxidase with cupredoxin domain